jgi:molecular chaperone Hsp33
LFLQELPKQESDKPDWERIAMLADTITKQEMLTLGCEEMLYRLFNEEKLRLFQQEPVTFKCTCSQKKIEDTLILLGRQELESSLQERNIIDVKCDFCAEKHSFDKVDIENLFAGQAHKNESSRQH